MSAHMVGDPILSHGIPRQFSATDVRWPDGRRVHRAGIVQDVQVNLTIDGIRQGRDDVLETALVHLDASPELAKKILH